MGVPTQIAALSLLGIGVQGLDYLTHISCEFIKSLIITNIRKSQLLDLVSEASVEVNFMSVIRDSGFAR